jgi:nucleoside-diphosphate-sugar epimerase
MSESKTLLISGGAGYIGSALVSRVLRDTNWHVKVFDDLMYGGNSLFQFYNFDRFSFIKGDLRKFQLEKILGGVDYVVNLAALVGEPICKKYPKEAKEINYEANLNLAKNCESLGISRYLMMSTCSNYGLRENQEMLTEEDELQPISLYSETKVESEKKLLNEFSNLPTIILRASTAYGMASRIRFDLLLHQFIFEAWVKKQINLFGANSWRPMVHVDDIARAIVISLTKNEQISHKDVFNVGSNDQNFKKIQLAKMVAERLNVDIVESESKKDPRDYRVSFDKIVTELGFNTIHNPKESIEQIAASLENGLIDENVLHESVNIKSD